MMAVSLSGCQSAATYMPTENAVSQGGGQGSPTAQRPHLRTETAPPTGVPPAPTAEVAGAGRPAGTTPASQPIPSPAPTAVSPAHIPAVYPTAVPKETPAPTVMRVSRSSITRETDPEPGAADVAAAVAGNKAFALDLYRTLAESRGQPVLLAPQHLDGAGHGLRRGPGRDGAPDGGHPPVRPGPGQPAPRVQRPRPLPCPAGCRGLRGGLSPQRCQFRMGAGRLRVPAGVPGHPGSELWRRGADGGLPARPGGRQGPHQRLGRRRDGGTDHGPDSPWRPDRTHPSGAGQRHLLQGLLAEAVRRGGHCRPSLPPPRRQRARCTDDAAAVEPALCPRRWLPVRPSCPTRGTMWP